MRKIDYRVVHCTATLSTASIQAILEYWKNEKKWDTVGYHIIIPADGSTVRLLPDEKIANGVKNFNQNSLHVCYVGGVSAEGKSQDTRTSAQKKSIGKVLSAWKKLYPSSAALGHKDFAGVTKDCPSFDVKKEYE